MGSDAMLMNPVAADAGFGCGAGFRCGTGAGLCVVCAGGCETACCGGVTGGVTTACVSAGVVAGLDAPGFDGVCCVAAVWPASFPAFCPRPNTTYPPTPSTTTAAAIPIQPLEPDFRGAGAGLAPGRVGTVGAPA